MRGTILLAIERGSEALRLTKYAGGYITLAYGSLCLGRWEHEEQGAAIDAFHEQALNVAALGAA